MYKKNIRKLVLISMILNLTLFSAIMPSYASSVISLQSSLQSSPYVGVKSITLGETYTSETLTVQPKNIAGTAITETDGMYLAFENFSVTYKDAVAGGMYMFFISDESTGNLSTEHLCDVVQVKAENSEITFASHPDLKLGKTYYAYISSSTPSDTTGLTFNAPSLAFSFQYALSDISRGDLDNNNIVNNADAQIILDYIVGAPGVSLDEEALTSADFDMNGTVDSGDAMSIMQYYAYISQFS